MRLLLLAGTQEARMIAGAVAHSPDVATIASLAEAERRPASLGVPTRIGGFGGRDAFAAYLARERVDAVLDATHPFAVRMSHRTAEVCTEAGVDYARFLRRPWMPSPDDRWTFLNGPEDAAAHIEPGASVFIATGRRDLNGFADLAPRPVWFRVLDPPRAPYPFEGGRFLFGRGPFTVASETALFRQLGIDWLVVHNSGGSGSWPKMDAARRLGLRVAVIRRPMQPAAVKLETVTEALAWIRRRQ